MVRKMRTSIEIHKRITMLRIKALDSAPSAGYVYRKRIEELEWVLTVQ